MLTEIQASQDIWPQLVPIIFVPRIENGCQWLAGLRNDLINLINENENHPSISLNGGC